MRNIRFEQRSSDGFLRVGHGKIAAGEALTPGGG